MKLKDSIKRLGFTISKGNKPNNTDAEAFNVILRHLKQEQDKTIQENLLFAKLYAFLLSELTNYYTDIDFANKEINKVLSEPMSIRIEILKMSLQRMEIGNYFNRKKILDPFLKKKTSAELIELHEKFKDKLPELNAYEFSKICHNWQTEDVVFNLETSVNLSIQNFKNNV